MIKKKVDKNIDNRHKYQRLIKISNLTKISNLPENSKVDKNVKCWQKCQQLAKMSNLTKISIWQKYQFDKNFKFDSGVTPRLPLLPFYNLRDLKNKFSCKDKCCTQPIWKLDLHCTPVSTTSETASYEPADTAGWIEEPVHEDSRAVVVWVVSQQAVPLVLLQFESSWSWWYMLPIAIDIYKQKKVNMMIILKKMAMMILQAPPAHKRNPCYIDSSWISC